MPEKDFWTKFFQSHYFHRDRNNTRAMSGDIFTECAKEDELEQLSRKLATFSDPLLDLTGASPVPEEGYGLTAEAIDPKNNVATQSLFRKLNHHSLMVLQTTAPGPPSTKKRRKMERMAKLMREIPLQKRVVSEEWWNMAICLSSKPESSQA